jgi:hypothetical protein
MSSHHNEKTKESFEDDVKSGPDTAADGESIAEVYDPALKAAIVKSDLKGFSRRSFMVRLVLRYTSFISNDSHSCISL